jgi:hypothetical protein
MNLTDKEIGYISGIIDGEGSICLHKCVWKTRNGIYYRPFIKIANTNLQVLKFIQSKLDCGSIEMDRLDTEAWKACYTLRFSANMIRQFLPIIIDSLIIKKEQALLLVEFLNMSKRGLSRNFKKNNDNLYVGFYNRIKSLNHRGTIKEVCEFGGTPTGTIPSQAEILSPACVTTKCRPSSEDDIV